MPNQSTSLKRIIYVHDRNGMANRLWPFAHLLAFGRTHGIKIVNPVFNQFRQYFIATADETQSEFWHTEREINRQQLHPEFTCCGWQARNRLQRFLKSGSTLQLSPNQNLQLSTLQQRSKSSIWIDALYTLDNDSFALHSGFLRRCFSPVPAVRDAVARTIESARKTADILVGVHIRQGDYRTFANGMLYFSTEEYASLMRKATTLWPHQKVGFLVCSDEPQDSRKLGGLRWTTGPGHEAADLFALAKCDFIIAAPSTFSQWSSWYGNVPRYVHNRKFEELHGVKASDLKPEAFHVHQVGFGKFSKQST